MSLFTFWFPLLLVIILIWAIVAYNKMQSFMQNIREAWSNIQATLQKRVDLTNQIIDIASSYGEHEKLTHITISNNVKDTLSNVKYFSQTYPELKANNTYQQLMMQIEDLEKTILQRREVYNQQVKIYNSYRNSFPAIVIATNLKFKTIPYFEIDDSSSLEKVTLFQRDDTEALQNALNKSGEALLKKISATKDKFTKKPINVIVQEEQSKDQVKTESIP